MAEAKLILMPPAKGKCQECAVDHDPALPHDQQSLYYQYSFFGKHGRWPTWEDAMAHCTDEVKKLWTEAMAETCEERGLPNPMIKN
jgi:hypothetical protein